MSKTFKDLKKGDIIYAVFTSDSNLKVIELPIANIEHESNTCMKIYISKEGYSKNGQSIYAEYFNSEKTITYYRYEYWHTTIEAAKKTIKETIKNRIKKHQCTIMASKRAIKNYKIQLKDYE